MGEYPAVLRAFFWLSVHLGVTSGRANGTIRGDKVPGQLCAKQRSIVLLIQYLTYSFIPFYIMVIVSVVMAKGAL